MKKIDLHIHTISTIFDRNFTFDIESLKKYISIAKLDCIAITNHNEFSLSNYDFIKENINIPVLPGIEVNLDNGHILVIANEIDKEKLEKQSKKLRQYIIDENSKITYEEFIDVFDNYKDYLLIPHYLKKPFVPNKIIEQFGNEIKVGEVSSAKKWFSTLKNKEMLVPVIFSDIRIEENMKVFPGTHLYINCEEFTVGSLKNALLNRTNISLSENPIENEFQILPDGTMASMGLNVLLGKRSTGKTFTLDTIDKSFGCDSTKYIKQFSIIKDAQESVFKKIIEEDNIKLYDSYLKELKEIVSVALKIDIKKYDALLEEYLNSVLKYADSQDKLDIFAKCLLFSEDVFNYQSDEELKKLIFASDTILSSEKHNDLIKKYIDLDLFKKLLDEFINKYRKDQLELKKCSICDYIITSTKNELQENSALDPIKSFDIVNYAKSKLFVDKFNKLINDLKTEKIIYKDNFYKFNILATRKSFTSVQNIRNKIKNCPSIKEEFKHYNDPYTYIHMLKSASVLENEIYKSIIDIEYNALNDNGGSISGGERAEYLLYKQIKDGEKYDMILIDEPESSFDNIYLNENIKSLINNLSKKTTTFIVTHNHILGVLLKADKILYTRYDDGKYKVYTGNITSKEFKCIDGSKIPAYDVLINTMEAGIEAYNERGEIYANIKN